MINLKMESRGMKLEKIVSKDLPVPINISNMWNFGSCLGVFLSVQIISGLLLSSHYCPNVDLAFDSVTSMSRDSSWGSVLRIVHLNGASMYFLMLYIHIGRGVYYSSYNYIGTWSVGFIIMLLSMMVAFLGYVLPWGQMSYWGATVITNLISAIPLVGTHIVIWIWGGFSISGPTLTRFFMIHFCLPFVVLALVFLHVLFLHKTGSQNPSNISSKYNILSFQPYFTFKDVMFFCFIFSMFELLIFLNPYLLGDPENFSIANLMSTPEHIVPEWYFLFAYAILRCIPSKGLGVVAMLTSVTIVLLPMGMIISKKYLWKLSKSFKVEIQTVWWFLVLIITILTWLGAQLVKAPFIFLSQLSFVVFLSIWVYLSMNPSS